MGKRGSAGAIASFVIVAALGPGPILAQPASVPAAGRIAALPCLPGFTAIRMTALTSGHHSVAVMLNGKAGVFLVDTGAGATIIHTPYLRNFSLIPASDGALGASAGGRAHFAPVAIAAFAVGEIRTRLRTLYAMDLSYLVDAVDQTSAQPIQGLIGQDVLRDQKALIDLDKSILYLKDAAGRGCGAPPARAEGQGTIPTKARRAAS